MKIRKARRRPRELKLPPKLKTRTDSVAILIADRRSAGAEPEGRGRNQ